MVFLYSWNLWQEYFMCSEYDSEFYVRENIIMQYTGIEDLKGKEIYEGDILSNDEECYKVVFENGSYRAEIEEYSLDLIDVAHCCEIVGNIYENPELLGD